MKQAILTIAWCWSLTAMAQQLDLRNQYFFDLVYVNAAYTGHPEALTASTTLRKQWVGFEGAPETFNLAVHSPLKNQNMGVGLQAGHDRIGPRTQSTIALSYAYRVRLSEQHQLRLGIRAGAENHRLDTDRIDYKDENDVIAGQGAISMWAPRFDFAALFTGNRYFAGIEAANLTGSRVRELELSAASQSLHLRFTGGYVIPLSEKVKLKPTALVRYASGAPISADLNLNALFLERFWIGAGYRINYGVLAMLQLRITQNLELGYAWDFATNPMRNQHAGSHELFLSYRFNVFRANFSSPRYF